MLWYAFGVALTLRVEEVTPPRKYSPDDELFNYQYDLRLLRC